MLNRTILKLDIGGLPQGWINLEDASKYICEDEVAWSMGSIVKTLHGGTNKHGVRSVIDIPSIIAVKGKANIYLPDVIPAVTAANIFKRDRCMCGYCGLVFPEKELQVEHIIPKARNGPWSWTNLVASCNHCNQILKKCRTPMEAGMTLRYLPYVPSYWESMIMKGRHILADQMEFLMASVPKHSRLRD
jgi:5-methylcytosine-specific restriction endonuclease McrA